MKDTKLTPALRKLMDTPMCEILWHMFMERRWGVSHNGFDATSDAEFLEDGTFEVRLPDGRTFEIAVACTRGPTLSES